MSYTSIDVLEAMLRAWPNVRKLLQYRHYDYQRMPEKIKASELNDQCMKTNGKVIITCHQTKTLKKMVIIFTPLYHVGIGPVRDYIEWMRANAVTNAIVLSMNGPTPFTIKGLSQADSYKDVKLEFFEYQHLAYCVADHEIQPKHFIMSKKSKNIVLSRYKIKQEKLPKIKESDPLAKFYGLEKGDMMKFICTNGAQEYSTRYRICM